MLRSRHTACAFLAASILAGCAAEDPASPLLDSAPSTPSTPADRARAFLAANPEAALATPADRFVMRDVVVDPDGREHVRFDRAYHGLRVIGGDLTTHSGDAPTLTLTEPLAVDVIPAIDARAATAAAVSTTGLGDAGVGATELVIYARRGLQALAYDVVLGGAGGELHAIIGAQDAALLDRWSVREAASGAGDGFYSGQVPVGMSHRRSRDFMLIDPDRGDTTTLDAMNALGGAHDRQVISRIGVFGDGLLAARSTVAVDAHYALAEAWDYFSTVHGRAGIAGDGKGIFARVHYGIDVADAFYDDGCACISVGDGAPNVVPGVDLLPFASLDVLGHEVTHGVTAHTAALLLSGEAGAIGEATGDIFGTMIERFAQNPEDPFEWTIGERLFSPPGRVLRSMADPESDGVSAGCYDKNVGQLDPHAASGIGNHFFYLLSEGTGPGTTTCGTTATFAGIGADAAEQIWYRALDVYFTSDTRFTDARKATMKAAVDLYGSKSAEHTGVKNAWAAVLVK